MSSFLTIQSPTEGLYKEKGSKFFAYAYPVTSEVQVKEKLEALRELHPKARHHCYAYRLGAAKTNFKANDAGEPANTAGAPILGQIRSMDLTNVLVVVVRYFGGTKLGVGGLIQAYREAASDALMQAEVISDFEKEELTVEAPYEYVGELQNFIRQKNVLVVGQDFKESCKFVLGIAKEDSAAIKAQLHELRHFKIWE